MTASYDSTTLSSPSNTSQSHLTPLLSTPLIERLCQGNKANDTLEVCARCILFRPTYALKHLEDPSGTVQSGIRGKEDMPCRIG